MSFVYGFIVGVIAALLGVYLFVTYLVDDAASNDEALKEALRVLSDDPSKA
jgi:hypothetical protein